MPTFGQLLFASGAVNWTRSFTPTPDPPPDLRASTTQTALLAGSGELDRGPGLPGSVGTFDPSDRPSKSLPGDADGRADPKRIEGPRSDDGGIVFSVGSSEVANAFQSMATEPPIAFAESRLPGGLTHLIDRDGDGVDLQAERQAGTSDDRADSDGDGLSDGEEVALGTDGTRFDSDGDGISDGLEHEWQGQGRGASDLGPGAGGTPSGGNPYNRAMDPLTPAAGASGLLRVTDGPDADGDGLSDADEVVRGTDPDRADTDGDGLSDGYEVLTDFSDATSADTDGDGLVDGRELAYGGDARAADTDHDGVDDLDEYLRLGNLRAADSDRDGRSDAEEAAADTPLWTSDNDFDGLTDAEEAELGTDPDRSDTDSDKLSDGYEATTTHTIEVEGPDGLETQTFRTDPTRGDTDGDGLGDGREVQQGTNAGAADTDGDGRADGADKFPQNYESDAELFWEDTKDAAKDVVDATGDIVGTFTGGAVDWEVTGDWDGFNAHAGIPLGIASLGVEVRVSPDGVVIDSRAQIGIDGVVEVDASAGLVITEDGLMAQGSVRGAIDLPGVQAEVGAEVMIDGDGEFEAGFDGRIRVQGPGVELDASGSLVIDRDGDVHLDADLDASLTVGDDGVSLQAAIRVDGDEVDLAAVASAHTATESAYGGGTLHHDDASGWSGSGSAGTSDGDRVAVAFGSRGDGPNVPVGLVEFLDDPLGPSPDAAPGLASTWWAANDGEDAMPLAIVPPDDDDVAPAPTAPSGTSPAVDDLVGLSSEGDGVDLVGLSSQPIPPKVPVVAEVGDSGWIDDGGMDGDPDAVPDEGPAFGVGLSSEGGGVDLMGLSSQPIPPKVPVVAEVADGEIAADPAVDVDPATGGSLIDLPPIPAAPAHVAPMDDAPVEAPDEVAFAAADDELVAEVADTPADPVGFASEPDDGPIGFDLPMDDLAIDDDQIGD